MNTSVIADSSGIISLIADTDKNHNLALEVVDSFKSTNGSIIVPTDVYSETLNVIGRKIGHDVAINVALELNDSEIYMVLDASEKTRQIAFELFKIQSGSVSFTDCVVMAFARQFNTKDIFGFDDVFRKNGYNRLGFDNK